MTKNIKILILSFVTYIIICANLMGQENINTFTIKGKTTGENIKNLVLIVFNKSKDRYPIKIEDDGSFEIKGVTDGVYPAEFQSTDGTYWVPLFIENNVSYTADINLNNLGSSVIKGGSAQNIFSDIEHLRAKMMTEERQLEDKYMPEFIELHRKSPNIGYKDSLRMEEIIRIFSTQKKESRKKEKELFIKNNDNIVIMFVLYSDIDNMETADAYEIYNMLSDRLRNSHIGKLVSTKLENKSKLDIGKIAPNFTLQSVNGKDISLNSIREKIIIIDFWASWCAPCRAENPNLKDIYNKYHSKGLEIISISLDKSRMAWTKAIKQDELPWIHLSDLMGEQSPVSKNYNINGIPFTLVLDKDKKILAKNLKGLELKETISKFLKDK